MRYVNPFSLLNIQPGSLFDNPVSIRSARKSVLADIALDHTVTINGVEISRSDAIRAFSELDHEIVRDIHARVLSYPAFHDFLTSGDTRIFDLYYAAEMYGEIYDDEFLRFVSPFYAEQFSGVMARAISNQHSDLISSMSSARFPMQPEWREKAYVPARRHFTEILEHVREIKEELAETDDLESIVPNFVEVSEPQEFFFNPFDQAARVEPMCEFLDWIINRADIRILNSLPEEFQLLRNNIVGELNNLLVRFTNHCDEHAVALEIADRATEIEAGGVDFDLLSKNKRLIKALVQKDLLELTEIQLSELSRQIQKHSLGSPSDAVKAVYKVFDVDGINSISSTTINNSIIVISKKLTEIAWRLVTSYNSKSDALAVLARGLQVRLSDPAVSETLLRSLTTAYGEIETTQIPVAGTVSQRREPSGKNRAGTKSGQSGHQGAAPRGTSSTKQYPPAFTAREPELTFGLSDQPSFLRGLLKNLSTMTIQQGTTAITAVVAVVLLIFAPIICVTLGEGPARREKTSLTNAAGTLANHNASSRSIVVPTPTANSNSAATPIATPSPKVERPNSGVVLNRGSQLGGLGQLSISNGTSKDAIAKLIDVSTGKSYREVYIRSNSSTSISGIAPGEYELVFSSGQDYAPSVKKFLRNAEYSKFDDRLLYQETRDSYGVRYKTFQVTLDKVAYGNASTSRIDEASFDR